MTTLAAPRRVPPLGGLNTTLLGLELRRLLRNRRTMIITLVMPVVFFLIFGLNPSYSGESAGNGNASAYVMISMAPYGAMIASTSGGAMVSVERASGWSRQLRLTPPVPRVYIFVKVLVAMMLGLGAVGVVYLVGASCRQDRRQHPRRGRTCRGVERLAVGPPGSCAFLVVGATKKAHGPKAYAGRCSWFARRGREEPRRPHLASKHVGLPGVRV
nr:ABC transporter permease subunit [Rhodococcus opacus]